MSLAEQHPFEPPASETALSLGEIPESFRAVNRRGTLVVATTAVMGLFFALLVGLAAYTYEGSLASGGIGFGLTALIAGAQVYRRARLRFRLGADGVSVGGDHLPWTDVFAVWQVSYRTQALLLRREDRVAYLAFHDGAELRAATVDLKGISDRWIEEASRRVRRPEELSPEERALIESCGGSP